MLKLIVFICLLLDESATIRVTNLSEDTRESDLQELFRPFGPISRIFLAKDKHTNQSKVIVLLSSWSPEEKAAFLTERLHSDTLTK